MTRTQLDRHKNSELARMNFSVISDCRAASQVSSPKSDLSDILDRQKWQQMFSSSGLLQTI